MSISSSLIKLARCVEVRRLEMCWAVLQGPYSRTSYDYRRLLIGRDGHLDQSEAYDKS